MLALRAHALLKAAGREGHHISLVFTDANTMRKFNLSYELPALPAMTFCNTLSMYRGVNKCTDVLSVPHEYFMHHHDAGSAGVVGDGAVDSSSCAHDTNSSAPPELGDIIICPSYVQRYCAVRNLTPPRACRQFGTGFPFGSAMDGRLRGGEREAEGYGGGASALQVTLHELMLHGVVAQNRQTCSKCDAGEVGPPAAAWCLSFDWGRT